MVKQWLRYAIIQCSFKLKLSMFVLMVTGCDSAVERKVGDAAYSKCDHNAGHTVYRSTRYAYGVMAV